MENHLQEAIEQMRKREEAGLRVIYSQTYNFVYLRAKSILKREEDIQKLVKEVYVQTIQQAKRIKGDNLYEWLGKWTYILGGGKYRRKKVREVSNIEWDDNDYNALKEIGKDSTREIICNTLEELPDMYQATLYAFYYDQMKIKDIAKVMDYSEEAIINRLNYTHKYLQKVLENYEEETKVNVQLSPEAIYRALKDWSQDNCLSVSTVQSIYMGICRELGFQVGAIEVDDREMAGAEKTVVKHEADDLSGIYDELEAYSAKPGMDKRQLVIVGAAVVAIAVIALIVILIAGNADKNTETDKNPVTSPTEQQQDEEMLLQESTEQDAEDMETSETPDIDENTEQVPVDTSEYILPNSSTQRLTRADLTGLTKEELRLARNEIYARHGMIFGAADLANYFATKSWYTPTVAYDDFYDKVTISDIEAANVSLIVEMEDEME